MSLFSSPISLLPFVSIGYKTKRRTASSLSIETNHGRGVLLVVTVGILAAFMSLPVLAVSLIACVLIWTYSSVCILDVHQGVLRQVRTVAGLTLSSSVLPLQAVSRLMIKRLDNGEDNEAYRLQILTHELRRVTIATRYSSETLESMAGLLLNYLPPHTRYDKKEAPESRYVI